MKRYESTACIKQQQEKQTWQQSSAEARSTTCQTSCHLSAVSHVQHCRPLLLPQELSASLATGKHCCFAVVQSDVRVMWQLLAC